MSQDSGKLDLPKISDGRVKHLVNHARNSYDNVVNLHERYISKKDNEYITAAEAKYCDLIEL